MHHLKAVWSGYSHVEPHIRNMIAAQFLIQSVNTSFFLLLNYFMVAKGFADYEVADVLSYRFFAVFWLAFPLGFFIRGRRLKPFLYAAAIGLPLFSHLLILAIGYQWRSTVNVLAMFWGASYMLMQVSAIPFILLNAKQETHSEGIALSFLSFSVTTCIVGIGNYLLHWINPTFFTEQRVLQLVATLSLLSVYFIYRISVKEKVSERLAFKAIWTNYDWRAISKAAMPTLIIAIGAGFTIPVINLFFLNVHGLSSNSFSLVGAATFFLVAGVMIFMPYIRRNFGYRVAITLFQSMAVFALFMLAATEWFKDWEYALYVAIFFYVVRQPLMNAAGPMTSELTMYYVGKRNQELMSALNASIWSGSWFVSTKVFGWLRQLDFAYVQIFMITVAFYIIGVVWYVFLIRAYERKQAAERSGTSTTKKVPAPVGGR
jgi:hypothetical protein